MNPPTVFRPHPTGRPGAAPRRPCFPHFPPVDRSLVVHFQRGPSGICLLLGLLPKTRLLRRYAPPKKIDFAENGTNGSKYRKNTDLQTKKNTGSLFSSRYQPRSGSETRNDKKCISVSLRAIRRIARQSQPSLWDFFNRPSWQVNIQPVLLSYMRLNAMHRLIVRPLASRPVERFQSLSLRRCS